MDINESFQIVVNAARNYRGTADEHSKIAEALTHIQVNLQEYAQTQQKQPETEEEAPTSDD